MYKIIEATDETNYDENNWVYRFVLENGIKIFSTGNSANRCKDASGNIYCRVAVDSVNGDITDAGGLFLGFISLADLTK